MKKRGKVRYLPGDGWNNIFKNPDVYRYYDLFSPHEDMVYVSTLFSKRNIHKILDLGCGLGNNLFYLNKMGFETYGIDASNTATSQVKEKIDELGLSVKVTAGISQKLPYQSNYFDAVISIQALHHGYEKDILKGISEIERVIKPDGLIFITLPGRISQNKLRYCLVKTAKKIEKNTYLPTIGDEIDVPHVIYNKKLIKRHYCNFKFIDLWKDDKDYYCFIAEYGGN